MKPTNHKSWAIRPLVPEEIYTDREEHLEYLCRAAKNAIGRRTLSTVLLGRRRMGKTELFKRAVNRLFFEQERYDDPSASVVPIYFSFPDQAKDYWQFSLDYVENFIRWYSAFRLRNIVFLNEKAISIDQLMKEVVNKDFVTEGFQHTLNLYDILINRQCTYPEKLALLCARMQSDWDESTIAVFLDEFQNTRMENFDIVGWMKEAVESNTCPHFVTGSAMSMLGREILGRGALFGRFQSHPIEPMTEYWGAQLALKSAHYYHAQVSETMTSLIADRCGGNPFYITAVIQQAVEQKKPLTSEKMINEILGVDLASGFIWGELNDQVNRWIERTNDHKITKWVLYLSALDENTDESRRGELKLDRIREELKRREGKDVSPDMIRDVLIRLSRGDLLDYLELGGWFRKTDDPILLDFLKVWGKIEVEGQHPSDAQKELVRKYDLIGKRIRDHKGYLAEIYMGQILWNNQNKTLPGRLFHSGQDIPIPWHFNYIRHRTRVAAGKDMEIDIDAAAGKEHWVGESKWRKDKVGAADVKSLLHRAELLREKEGEGLQILRVWFFSYSGFTSDAEQLLEENGVLWSAKDDLNQLLAMSGLRQLPEIDL